MQQDMLRPKVNLDWGLGQLCPKKRQNQDVQAILSSNQIMPITTHAKDQQRQQKIRKLQEDIKLLTQSSEEQQRELLLKILKKYKKKQQQKQTSSNYGQKSYSHHNRGYNVLQDFEFHKDSNSYTNSKMKQSQNLNLFKQRSPKKERLDTETSKRVRYLQNSLLPPAKRDHIGTILDYQMAKNVEPGLEQSRMSRRSVSGNKKNETTLVFGTGYNQFAPLKQKVKDMNTKLRQMYDYQERCKKRDVSQVRMG